MTKQTITIENGIATLEDGKTIDLLKIQSAINSAAQDLGDSELMEALDDLSRITRKWQGPHGEFMDGSYHDSFIDDLRTGADADIWYDARQYGDTEKEQLIDQTKTALYTAADLLEAGEEVDSVLQTAKAKGLRIEATIEDLQQGLNADIWYDAHEYGDITAMNRIEITQNSMSEAIAKLTLPAHEQRLDELEQEGMTRSDAQAVLEAQEISKTTNKKAPKF